MTTFDVRPAGPAADLSAARFEALTAELERLRGEHAELEQLRRENAELKRLTDDVLDRESMHVYDAGMECLTTAAELERRGTPRATHLAVVGQAGSGKSGLVRRALAQAFGQQHTLPAPAVEAPEVETPCHTMPDMTWGGFDR
ncbi:hypothetical protein ACWEP5_27460 [Nocardia niigatensis]